MHCWNSYGLGPVHFLAVLLNSLIKLLPFRVANAHDALAKGKSLEIIHPYRAGNFAPVQIELPLTPCIVAGIIPVELAGGEYIRNGGNPALPPSDDARFHWFDGDGMLSGVYFPRTTEGVIVPHFVNSYILTDMLLHSRSTPTLRRPLPPSIAFFADPFPRYISVIWEFIRVAIHALLSHFPGAKQTLYVFSTANTALVYHDGRALATCDSGPPIRVQLPELATVGWFNGAQAEGESEAERHGSAFGEGDPILGWMKQWTAAHPHVDPYTKEMILYHSMSLPPYLLYSVLPARDSPSGTKRVVSFPVPNIAASKLLHDFACTLTHTILLDMPLYFDPFTTLKLNPGPMIRFDPAGHMRFGFFSRHEPSKIQWIEDKEGGPCYVFHTAASWDEHDSIGMVDGASILGCRLNSLRIISSVGNIPALTRALAPENEKDECQLYYWRLDYSSLVPVEAFSLSAIPLEFPTAHGATAMGRPTELSGGGPRYVWGCALWDGAFGAELGVATKLPALAKLDVTTLIAAGHARGGDDRSPVDKRSLRDIVQMQEAGTTRPDDPITVFVFPPGWYAQEATFVPRTGAIRDDDGFLITYVFDEAQLDVYGNAPPSSRSELWIIDAMNMRDVIARVVLPQRIPYGLHGEWFTEEDVKNQRPVARMRKINTGEEHTGLWTWLRQRIERLIG